MELQPGTEVEAKRPGGRKRRTAKVQEAATKGVHDHVKVKFPGDLTIYTLPWKDINTDHLSRPAPKSKQVSTSASSVDIIDVESLNDEADRTSSVETRPFAPTARSRGNTKEQDRRRDMALQRMEWLPGMQKEPKQNIQRKPDVVREPVSPDSSVIRPDMHAALPNTSSNDFETPGTLQASLHRFHAKPGTNVNISQSEAGAVAYPLAQTFDLIGRSDNRSHPGAGLEPDNRRAVSPTYPPTRVHHYGSRSGFLPFASPIPPREHEVHGAIRPPQESLLPALPRMRPGASRAERHIFPWQTARHDSYPRQGHSHATYLGQARLTTNSLTPPHAEPGDRALLSPSRKKKEGLLEFTAFNPSQVDNITSAPGAHPRQHRSRTASESEHDHFMFTSPSKRQRIDFKSQAVRSPASRRHKAVQQDTLGPVLVPRHPLRGLSEISIPRYREQFQHEDFRIPRRKGSSEQSRHERPCPYDASTNECPELGTQRRLDLLVDTSTKAPFISHPGDSFPDATDNQGEAVLVNSEIFRHRVIARTSRPPVGPVAKSFKGNEKFPFQSEDLLTSTEMDAEVMRICDEALKTGRRNEEMERKQLAEISRDLEAVSVSQKSSESHKKRKSAPKRWRSRALPHVATGVLSGCTSPQHTVPEQSPSDEVSNLRIYDCICGVGLSERGALQCGMCGLWSHSSCVQTYREIESRNGAHPGLKLFMCVKCTEKSVTETGILGSVTDNNVALSDPSNEGVSFFFAHIPVNNSNNGSAEGLPHTDGPMAVSRRGATVMVRPPLTAADIRARAANVELLRSGVPGPSAGKREQDLIDVQIRDVHRPAATDTNEERRHFSSVSAHP